MVNYNIILVPGLFFVGILIAIIIVNRRIKSVRLKVFIGVITVLLFSLAFGFLFFTQSGEILIYDAAARILKHEITLLDRTDSPRGTFSVYLYYWDGGVVGGHATQARLLRSEEKFHVRKGRLVFSVSGQPEVQMEWESEDFLLIRWGGCCNPDKVWWDENYSGQLGAVEIRQVFMEEE